MDSGKESTESNTLSLGKLCNKIGELEKQIYEHQNSNENEFNHIDNNTAYYPTSGVLEQRLSDIEAQIDNLEDQGRRNNLKLYNVPEYGKFEAWSTSEEKVRGILRSMDIPNANNLGITRAHRVYTGDNTDAPRPIIVKFDNFKDKQTILYASNKLQGNSVKLSEDFCQRTNDYRKNTLVPKMKEARANGKYAVLRHRRLVIKDKKVPYVTNNANFDKENAAVVPL